MDMSIDVQSFKTLFPAIATHCDDDGLDALLSVTTERSVSAGDVVIREYEETGNLYFVIDGELVSTLQEGDSEWEIGTINAGSTFCKANLLDPGPACTTVTAVSDAVLLSLSCETFRQLETEHLQMTGNILRMLSDELVELCRNADRMLFKRSAGIEDESQHQKHTSLMEWATHVYKNLHG